MQVRQHSEAEMYSQQSTANSLLPETFIDEQ